MKQQLNKLYGRLKHCYFFDRYPLQKQLQKISRQLKKNPSDNNLFESPLADCENKIMASIDKVRLRQEKIPAIDFPENLPISQKLTQIQQAINEHQVIVVAGETGSGKTTQLPKICLTVGRGIYGQIAHTQPRRIAARTVATRIAQELTGSVGEAVGYKVRFNERSREATYIKLMTDGILLAETQTDRLLNRYDTIIIDEAHERSLNIDFLLGYIKKLLPRRPELKVIITSATIDTKRFADFFDQAPVIEVSGRTFPVEVRYRPLIDMSGDTTPEDKENKPDLDMSSAILEAVDELAAEKAGDVLIFLSGEREIRETAEALRKHHPPHTEILPLYARLSHAEQNRVFAPHQGHRIVLATNVAETSLTVPGIRYVIDTGLARISRYSVRHKIQRLPIEKVSQASARQRSGRCGRVSAGIAIRLYAEQEFQQRPEFTAPEILRTNLAQVILQMLALRLGEIEDFPFLEKPSSKQVNDGFLLLEELGAIKSARQLTSIGRMLTKLSVDPKIGRVIIAAEQLNVLSEVLIIAAGLSCQEPRERPVDKQQAADEKHAQFASKQSDFISYIKLWCIYEQQRKHLSHNKLRQYCKINFLSFMRMREWRELYQQLYTQTRELGFRLNELHYDPAADEDQLNYVAIHQSLLTGFISNVAFKEEKNSYLGTRNKRLAIFPGSKLYRSQPKWVMAAEIVETSNVYARTVAAIEPLWMEQQAKHLLKKHYYDPFWEPKPGQVSAWCRLTLYGLVINPRKKINYGPVEPVIAREIFIRDALVSMLYRDHHKKLPAFIKHNMAIISKVEQLEHKSRRKDLLVDDLIIFEFFNHRIGPSIYSRAAFEKWRKQAEKENPRLLYLNEQDLLQQDTDHVSDELYPAVIQNGELSLPLEYHFLPGHPLDGVTVSFPLALINQIDEKLFEWLVPGLIREKITLMLRTLPKSIRKQFVPIPDTVTRFLESVEYRQGGLQQRLLEFLSTRTEIIISSDLTLDEAIPTHLKMNYQILDQQGKELDSSRELSGLKKQWSKAAAQQLETGLDNPLERKGIERWDFPALPEQLEVERYGVRMTLYPALVDAQHHVDIKLFDSIQAAQEHHWQGVFRLIRLTLREQLKQLHKHLPKLNKLCLLFTPYGKCAELAADLVDAIILNSVDGKLIVRNENDFKQLIDHIIAQMPLLTDEVCNATYNALAAKQQLTRQLKGNIPFNLINCIADVNNQADQLIYKGFVQQTPLIWLKRMPRYIKAMGYRIDKAKKDYRKDALLQAQIAALRSNYKSKNNQLHACWMNDELSEYRWLLEELSVSQFAQELKTCQPVSIKRLEKKWQQLSKS